MARDQQPSRPKRVGVAEHGRFPITRWFRDSPRRTPRGKLIKRLIPAVAARRVGRRIAVKYVKRFVVTPGAEVKLKDIDPGFKDHHKSHKEAADEIEHLQK